MHPFFKIKENIYLFLYNNKVSVLYTLRILSILFSIGGVGLMVYFYGFPHSYGEKENLIRVFKGLFAYYIFSYFIRLIYSFEIRRFLKETWAEGFFLGVLLVDAIGYFVFNQTWLEDFIDLVGFINFYEVHAAILQIYLFILIALEFGKINLDLSSIKVNPALLFTILFTAIILSGAGLLMLPEMTNPIMENGVLVNKSMNFVDALFTSASATCVTGLMVENTHDFFSFKGHLVLLGLIKVGGINIVAFGFFITFFSRFGLRLKQHDIIEDIVNKDTELSAKGLFAKILVISLIIETIGASLIFLLLPNSHPDYAGVGDKILYAFFHSVSAFNSAGISLFSNGLATDGIATSYPMLLVLSAIIFMGSLGFIAILEIIDFKQLKIRIQKPWKKISIASRVAILSSIHLIVFGVLFFMFFEKDNLEMQNMKISEKIITSIFQVVNRTAGFNSIDFSVFTYPVIVIFIALMFIGGSSSSTAGGIKTSTFTIIAVSVKAIIQGKKNVEIFKKNISNDLVIKAYLVFLFAILNLFIFTLLLCISEATSLQSGKFSFIELLFEEVSAFSTVGLSMGITSDISPAGRIIMAISMFIGRIGTLMVLIAITKKSISTKYKYPDAHIMIG
jgi:Trk-type K+ transport system membrane component